MSFNKGTSAHNHKFLLLLCAHENNNLLSEKKKQIDFLFFIIIKLQLLICFLFIDPLTSTRHG